MQQLKKLVEASREITIECMIAIGRADRYAWNETRKLATNVAEKVRNKKKDSKKTPLLSDQQENTSDDLVDNVCI